MFIKKEALPQLFSWEYWETPILQNNCELLLLLIWRFQINGKNLARHIYCKQMLLHERVLLTKIMKFCSSRSKFIIIEASTRGVLWKKVLLNFTKFTGKDLCQSLPFTKVADLRRFLVNFVKCLGTPFFHLHLWATATVISQLKWF